MNKWKTYTSLILLFCLILSSCTQEAPLLCEVTFQKTASKALEADISAEAKFSGLDFFVKASPSASDASRAQNPFPKYTKIDWEPDTKFCFSQGLWTFDLIGVEKDSIQVATVDSIASSSIIYQLDESDNERYINMNTRNLVFSVFDYKPAVVAKGFFFIKDYKSRSNNVIFSYGTYPNGEKHIVPATCSQKDSEGNYTWNSENISVDEGAYVIYINSAKDKFFDQQGFSVLPDVGVIITGYNNVEGSAIVTKQTDDENASNGLENALHDGTENIAIGEDFDVSSGSSSDGGGVIDLGNVTNPIIDLAGSTINFIDGASSGSGSLNDTMFHIDAPKHLTLTNSADKHSNLYQDNDGLDDSVIEVHGGTVTIQNDITVYGYQYNNATYGKFGATPHVAPGAIGFAPHGTVSDGTVKTNAHYEGGTVELIGSSIISQNGITTTNFNSTNKGTDYKVTYGTIDITLDGATVDANGYGIYLENVNEDITITIKNGSAIFSRNNAYSGIYLKNCTGRITITIDESSHIAFTQKTGVSATTGYGIYMSGCTNKGNTITTGGKAASTLAETKVSGPTVVDTKNGTYSQKGSNRKDTDTKTTSSYSGTQRIERKTTTTYTNTGNSGGFFPREYYFSTTTTVTETVYNLSYTASQQKGLRTDGGTVVTLNGKTVTTGTNYTF